MHLFFKELLLFHMLCSSVIVFQLRVHTVWGKGAVKEQSDKHGRGEGVENCQKCAGILYGRPQVRNVSNNDVN